MDEKKFSSRIINKHDTEENWKKAKNFIPRQSEFIVYDIDDIYNYERIKIGDGVHNVNDLPFIDMVGKITKQNGEIFNDYENNKSLNIYAMASGRNTQAGSKAFTIKDITQNEDGSGTYTLDSVEGISELIVNGVRPEFSVHISQGEGSLQCENVGIITSVDITNNTVIVSKVFDSEQSGSFDISKFNPNLDISEYIDEEGLDSEIDTFRIPSNPELGTRSIGFAAHAENNKAKALSKGSHAEGNGSVAAGSWSHAEGRGTYAIYSAHAEGSYTKALGQFSHAEGDMTEAKALYAHAEGKSTEASGIGAHSEGYTTIASERSSHAEGESTLASGVYTHAEGYSTEAVTTAAHAEGYDTIASGVGSHAEGNKTIAQGDSSHAEGQETQALGVQSHAEGFKTQATAYRTHAEGSETIASATGAHAEGTGCQATKQAAHAEGNGTVASGADAHAEGLYAKALHDHSHAGGWNTKTSAKFQTVIGKLNADNSNALLIVGNGTADSIEGRTNAFTVNSNGTATIGTAPVNDMDVANKYYVDNGINSLDDVLRDILNAIKSSSSAMQTIDVIEQTIVSYLENKTVAEVGE